MPKNSAIPEVKIDITLDKVYLMQIVDIFSLSRVSKLRLIALRLTGFSPN